MGVRQSSAHFGRYKLPKIQVIQVLTRGIGWMVGGTGDGGNIIRAWTGRKIAMVERKRGGECFTIL